MSLLHFILDWGPEHRSAWLLSIKEPDVAVHTRGLNQPCSMWCYFGLIAQGSQLPTTKTGMHQMKD